MSDVEPNRSTLLRDSVSIVATGAVLGLAFNAIGLASRPSRGLPWVAAERVMESAEQVGAPRAEAIAPGVPSSVVHASTPARPSAPRSPSVPAPADPAPPAASSDAADLPAIPDVGRPLEVSRSTVAAFVAAEAAVIVDAREPAAFASGHIPGAVNVPFEEATRDPAALRALDPKGRPVIVYCSGGDCEASKELADVMVRDYALRRVLVYRGGFPDWEAAGQPVSRSAP